MLGQLKSAKERRKYFSCHPAPVPEEGNADERQGLKPPFDNEDQPRTLLEQHCFLDLDKDGYKEPYVVTVSKDTSKVYRIVSRFDKITTEQSVKIDELQKRIRALAEGLQPVEQPTAEDLAQIQRAEATIQQMQTEIEFLSQQKPKVLKIEPVEHYTKIPFVPSPDGGFYDLGLGQLMGDMGGSVNTLINQLIDSGSLQNSNTGFIGKGARIKGGKVRFLPGEWKRVNVAGSTLKDAIVPLPVNDPSPVLFNLLSLLINYSERVGSVTDAMSGENPGQNTPAYNMSAMLEQGLQVFNGVFKRVYRSMRSEFRKLYKLNALYLDQENYFSYQDSDISILRTDYTADPKDLIPAADPNAFSNKEKMQKSQMILERSQMTPGYDPIAVEKRWLASLDIPDVNEIFPVDEQGQYVFPPQPDPELEIKKADMQRRTLEGKVRSEVDMMKAESQIMVDQADILVKMAQAEVAADTPEYNRLKLILEEQESIRKSLVEMAKIDESKRQAKEGLDRKSSNNSS
jgi:chaperonin GroES